MSFGISGMGVLKSAQVRWVGGGGGGGGGVKREGTFTLYVNTVGHLSDHMLGCVSQ